MWLQLARLVSTQMADGAARALDPFETNILINEELMLFH